jgi:hypothetical protein
VLSFAAGQVLWTIYEQVLRQPRFPSWADAAFLSAYLLLVAGALRVAGLRQAWRGPWALGAALVMAAAITASWFVLLGPRVDQGAATWLGELVGTAYPAGDLVLVVCVVLLCTTPGDGTMRLVAGTLAASLGIVVLTDSIFTYQQLQGTYQVGTPLDVGWSLGYMLVALAAQALRLGTTARAGGESIAAAGEGARRR